MRRRASIALAAWLTAAGACAARGPAVEAFAEAELLVEVLPRHAAVQLDGELLGTGGRAVRAPAPGRHLVAVSAAGFEPAEVTLPDGPLAGARVGVALRPVGFGTARRADYDEPGGLALAAGILERAGRHQDALDYAERALALDAGQPLAHRARGDALASLGRRAEARAAWGRYLELRPEAPDRAALEAHIVDGRPGVDLPGDRAR